MMRTRIVIISLALMGVALAQSWVLPTPYPPFKWSRFDGEYFPSTGYVYFLGGRLGSAAGNGTIDSIYRFDPVAGTYAWTGARLTVGVSNYDICLVRDMYNPPTDSFGLYIIGGRNGATALSFDTVQVYYPKSNTVRIIATDTWPARGGGYKYSGHAAVVYNNKIFCFGGFVAQTYTPMGQTWVFDPLASPGSRWTQYGSMPAARAYPMGCVVDSFIYSMGGDTAYPSLLLAQPTCCRLNGNNPGAGWQTIASLPHANGESRAFGFNNNSTYGFQGKVIVASTGTWASCSTYSFIYDTKTNTWASFPSVLKAVRNQAATFIPGGSGTNGRPGMWIWGGYDVGGIEPTDTSEYYQMGYDVGCTKIVAPTGGPIDSATSVTPACSVYNWGSQTASYNARFKVGSLYNQTVAVSSHAPQTWRYLTFPAWSAAPVGKSIVSCSTELGTDCYWPNDKKIDSVTVRLVPNHNVGCTKIIAPAGPVDSGTSVAPACSVFNYGNQTETFSVRMKIGAGYNNTASVTSLPSLTRAYVTFAGWTALPRGSLATSCSTQLSGDAVPANDKQTGTVTVNVRDVQTVSIDAPTDGVDSGVTITPQATVRNNGNAAATFNVRLVISGGYSNTRNVAGLAPGATQAVSFMNWTPLIRGSYTASCTTQLTSDMIPGNDRKDTSGNIRVHDYAATAIVAPTGSILPGAIAPVATVHNKGTGRDVGKVYFRINATPAYADSIILSNGLPVGADTTVTFSSWTASTGSYVAKCSTGAATDQVPVNNVLAHNFTVMASDSSWVRLADMPAGSKSKNEKDGCCIAGVARTDTSFVYALKGNGRCEFYRYNVQSNTWATMESIPAVGRTGKKKAVKKGACMTAAGDTIYAAKGNGTLEFWRYIPATNSWAQMADVPTGAKSVKEGAGAASVVVSSSVDATETTFVYLLKGSGTTEFYRFNTLTNTWFTLATAPSGASGKPYKDGSGLCAEANPLPSPLIWIVKGSYNEFYSYNVGTSTWTTKAPMPLVGRSGKKVKIKSGAGLAYRAGYVRALKGDNSLEYWHYFCDSDKWIQSDDVPLTNGKKVKGGGAITTIVPAGMDPGGSDVVTPGNNTLGTYGRPAPNSLVPTGDDGGYFQSMSAGISPLASRLMVAPNPFTSATTISYSLPKAGNVSLKLYDVTGKLVTTLVTGCHNSGTSNFTLHPSSLSCGIYLLKFETDNTILTSKLIIQ